MSSKDLNEYVLCLAKVYAREIDSDCEVKIFRDREKVSWLVVRMVNDGNSEQYISVEAIRELRRLDIERNKNFVKEVIRALFDSACKV